MEYKNKLFPLTENFLVKDIEIADGNKLEIILIELEYIRDKSYMFHQCKSLEEFPFYEKQHEELNDDKRLDDKLSSNSEITNSDVENISIQNLTKDSDKSFIEYSSFLESISPDISQWNTSNITNMSHMFDGCLSLKILPDISKWNTSNVTNMSYMFNDCSSLISLPDISKWNINNVTNISYMFNGCRSLTSLPDISKWNINNLIKFEHIYENCSSIIYFPNISKWKSFYTLNPMFEKNSTIFEINYENKKGEEIIQIFDELFVRKNKLISKMIIENKIYSLRDKHKLENNLIKNLNIKLIILTNDFRLNLKRMFYNCKSLINFSISNELSDNFINEKYSDKEKLNKTIKYVNNNISKNINKFKFIYFYSNKEDLSSDKLEYMKKIITFSHSFSSLQLSFDSWKSKKISFDKTIKVNKYILSLEASKLSKRVDVSKFNDNNNYNNSNNISIKNLDDMFHGCSSLKSVSFIPSFNIINVRSINGLFEDCSSLTTITDMSHWKTDNCKYMKGVFANCKSLLSLPDISKWNTSNTINMSDLFKNCLSLLSLPDISIWNTNKITNMKGLFQGCSSLSSLPDISKWKLNTSSNISDMFKNCSSLSSLPDISKWNTFNEDDINNLFSGCSSLSSLPDISKWKFFILINKSCLFDNCISLLNTLEIKWDVEDSLKSLTSFKKELEIFFQIFKPKSKDNFEHDKEDDYFNNENDEENGNDDSDDKNDDDNYDEIDENDSDDNFGDNYSDFK